MYKKIRNFCAGCWENDNMLRIFLVLLVIFSLTSFIGFTVKNGWQSALHYPEESYQEIETEANRIFETKDFDTEYRYEIDSYYSDTKYLSFTIYGENNTFIRVRISSFGLPDSEISTRRASKNGVSHFFSDIVVLVVIAIMLSLLAFITILILVSVVWFISFIIYKIISYIQKK